MVNIEKVKNLILIIITQFLFSAHSNSQELKYADGLDSYLEQSEIILLNEACTDFEEQLKKRYPTLELERAYLQYLKDLGEMKIHPSFFFSNQSKSVLQKIKSSSLFDKIWINIDSLENEDMFGGAEAEIIPITIKDKEEEEKQEVELYCVNPKAAYFKCVSSNAINREMKKYYEALGMVPDLSPSLKSRALGHSLKKSNFKNEVFKLSIVVEFYLEMALFFKEG